MKKEYSQKDTQPALDTVRALIDSAQAVVAGIGSGMSTSAGLVYDGENFTRHFSDFEQRFGFHDMYTGGFYPFPDDETKWAYWSRFIYLNRYEPGPLEPYTDLLRILKDKDFFVITTNVDHQCQKAGFDKTRLFYTQGDYGLFQCSLPCHAGTYGNEAAVRAMLSQQHDMRIPPDLIPRCPVCGRKMSMNLRSDSTFVEDSGWHEASKRYVSFLNEHRNDKVVYLELGVGFNTPGIIKYPFWQLSERNRNAFYITVNQGQAYAPGEILERSICIDGDIGDVLKQL